MPDPRDRKNRQKASKPSLPSEGFRPPSSSPRDYQQSTPVFCLHHLHPDYSVQALGDKDSQAQLALTMHKCAQLRWIDVHQTGRHASGSELIPASQIKAPIPPKFSDQDKFVSIRYHGKLPMVGVRIKDVFHVLWVERQYGDVYDHGD